MRGCTANWDRTCTGASGVTGCRGGRAGGTRGRRGAPFFTRRRKSTTSGVRGLVDDHDVVALQGAHRG